MEAVVARMQGRKKATSQKVFDTTETEKSKTKLWIERETREGEVCVFECVFWLKNKGAEALSH